MHRYGVGSCWIDSVLGYEINEIHYNKNIGYSGAINELSAVTSSEILCAVNADTWFTTKHVKDMIDCFEENPDVAIAGPKQMDENNKIRHGGIFWSGDKSDNPKHRGWTEEDPDDRLYKDLVPCWTVSGSLYYVRREAWYMMTNHPNYQALFPQAKGAFLPTPHFFEETFCSVWAQKLGYQVWYNGLAETAGHTWHASSDVGQASRQYFNVSRNLYIGACERLGIHHEC